MLRVVEQYAGTDTGRQRRANEDSLFARAPLFVVADGMGGAQAGEVASRIAVETFQPGLDDGDEPEHGLAEHARTANAHIHELSHSNPEHAGMGTTLTAIYVGEEEVAIAHVGDSRAYCLRDGVLERLTDDHSLVDELIRQGRLTPEEAVEHPQRSVITRALGPEAAVEVDTRSFRARDGDVFLLCSDGLTTMVSETLLAEVLRAHPRLRDAGESLIAAANEAGGRDNITVLLLRVEELPVDGSTGQEHITLTGVPALQGAPIDQGARRLSPRRPGQPASNTQGGGASSNARVRVRLRRAGTLVSLLVVLGLLGSGAYLASQSAYFLGTNSRGLVTLYRGVPLQLPAGVNLYSSAYVSGVSAATLPPRHRRTLLDHSLRSQGDAAALMRSLELGQLGK
jgi:serine/threonine protein phosphatase PrpC